MKQRKQIEKRAPEKSYSYDEFLQEYYPNQNAHVKTSRQDPRELGKTLAEDAVKTIREHLAHR